MNNIVCAEIEKLHQKFKHPLSLIVTLFFKPVVVLFIAVNFIYVLKHKDDCYHSVNSVMQIVQYHSVRTASCVNCGRNVVNYFQLVLVFNCT